MSKKSITNTTICAVATPPGAGAISIIRLSGSSSLKIAKKIWKSSGQRTTEPYKLSLGWVFEGTNKIDQAMMVYMPAPNSYTGEDVVEIHLHGSPVISKKVLELLVKNGAQLAQPGEFTKRAFLAGKLDLTQAEAVGDLINAANNRVSKLSSQQLAGELTHKILKIKKDLLSQASFMAASLDFSEEDIAANSYQQQKINLEKTLKSVVEIVKNTQLSTVLRDGLNIALIGLTNAGKSTLLNCLVGYNRSIVTKTAGTTRDTLTETIIYNDFLFNITDTAGLRSTADRIEKIGINRTIKVVNSSDISLLLVAPNKLSTTLKYLKKLNLSQYLDNKNCILVYTKSDLNKIKNQTTKNKTKYDEIFISAKTNKNISKLLDKVLQKSSSSDLSQTEYLLTKRQEKLLRELRLQLQFINSQILNNIPPDILLIEYQKAITICNQITGEDVTEEVIAEVFSNFCIGK